MLICLGSILLVDMRSIGTSHVRIRYVKYVTSARTYESAESTRLINCSGLMIRYGGSIRKDSCGDGGSILFLRITATLAFNPIIVYSTYILHIMSTSLP